MSAQTKVPASLDKLDDDKLMSLWTDVGNEATRLRDDSRRIGREVERRQLQRELDAKLSPAERELLGLPPAQEASPEGIESKESVSG